MTTPDPARAVRRKPSRKMEKMAKPLARRKTVRGMILSSPLTLSDEWGRRGFHTPILDEQVEQMDACSPSGLYSRVDELLEYLVCFATLCRQVHGQWVAHLCG